MRGTEAVPHPGVGRHGVVDQDVEDLGTLKSFSRMCVCVCVCVSTVMSGLHAVLSLHADALLCFFRPSGALERAFVPLAFCDGAWHRGSRPSQHVRSVVCCETFCGCCTAFSLPLCCRLDRASPPFPAAFAMVSHACL